MYIVQCQPMACLMTRYIIALWSVAVQWISARNPSSPGLTERRCQVTSQQGQPLCPISPPSQLVKLLVITRVDVGQSIIVIRGLSAGLSSFQLDALRACTSILRSGLRRRRRFCCLRCDASSKRLQPELYIRPRQQKECPVPLFPSSSSVLLLQSTRLRRQRHSLRLYPFNDSHDTSKHQSTITMFAKSFVALAVATAAVLGQQINTPASLTVCQPTLLSWSGGQAPYFLSVIPGGQASAAPLKDFDQQSDTSETWTVDIPAGTSITLKLTDSTGNTVYSSPVTISEGSSTSCLNAAGGASSAASGSASASSATGAVSSAVASASSYVTWCGPPRPRTNFTLSSFSTVLPALLSLRLLRKCPRTVQSACCMLIQGRSV